MPSKKVLRCPVCIETQIEKKVGIYNQCAICTSLYTPTVPTSHTLITRIESWGKEFAHASNNEAISLTNHERVAFLSKYTANKKLIDVGCGSGNFLKAAQQVGYTVYGMDKSQAIVARIRQQGIPAYTSLREVKHRFDLLTCFDVIEHIPNPVKFLREIKRIMKKNGLLFVTTPNNMSISALILKKYWWVFGPDDHYVLFNVHSLKLLLEKEGFTFIDIKTDTLTQWFHLQNKIFNKIANKSVYLFLLPFKNLLFEKRLGDNIQILARLN